MFTGPKSGRTMCALSSVMLDLKPLWGVRDADRTARQVVLEWWKKILEEECVLGIDDTSGFWYPNGRRLRRIMIEIFEELIEEVRERSIQ